MIQSQLALTGRPLDRQARATKYATEFGVRGERGVAVFNDTRNPGDRQLRTTIL
jgi:hypothetical protein